MSNPVLNCPIGVFDSGIGGLTTVDSIIASLPSENIVYVGDTLHHPYGNQDAVVVRQYAAAITDFLLQQRCKMIVIACHTVSSIAYSMIVEQVAGRALVVNVVDPLIAYLMRAYSSKHLGLIATKLTIDSGVYQTTINNLGSDITITPCAAPLLASAVEAHCSGNLAAVKPLLEIYLNSLPQDIDGVILGSTHYAIVKEQVDAFYQGRVAIIDVNPVLVELITTQLTQAQLLNDQDPGLAQYVYYASGDLDAFAAATRTVLGKYGSALQFAVYNAT